MKKNIPFLQSLLLLSLGSAPSLFSMDSPHVKLENSIDLTDVINAEFMRNQENDEENTPLLMLSLFGPESDMYEEDTIYLPDPKPAIKKEAFQNLHQELLTNPVALKTPELASINAATFNEDWINEYELWINKYEDVTKEITTTEITLKNKITAPKEHQDQFRHVINLLTIDNATAHLKAPKQYPKNSNILNLLTESIITTPRLSHKGLSTLPYTYQYGYECGTHKPHHIIEYLFTNTETDSNKKAQYLFDLNNETHLELLEQTLGYYVDQNDTEKIMYLLEKCQCTAGELQINTRVVSKLHQYFENIIKNEEADSKIILKNKNDEYVAKSNALIVALQDELIQRTKQLYEEFNTYTKECDDTFTKKAHYIRQLKKNVLATHVLAPDLKLSKHECSDVIHYACSHVTKTKVYMTQQDVKAVCSNEQLLKKIELDKSMNTIQQNTYNLLEHVSAIKRATQGVKLLTL